MYELSMVVDLAGQIRVVLVRRFQNNLQSPSARTQPSLTFQHTFDPFVSL
jgi:hypothetical protein